MLSSGGIDPCGSRRPSPYSPDSVHLATLCRFDHIYLGTLYLGPFIPCERRLAIMRILEIQGRDYWSLF